MRSVAWTTASRSAHVPKQGHVVELLARGFTRLDRAIDQLSSFWDVDFWRIALERVATGRGDGAGDGRTGAGRG